MTPMHDPMHDPKALQRRILLKAAGALALAGAVPRLAFAQAADPHGAQGPSQTEQHFAPQPGDWKSYEVTTRVDLQHASGPSTVWVPLPVIDTDWQRTLSNNWSGNASKMSVGSDPHFGAQFLVAEFDGSAAPHLEVVSRVQTRNRKADWKKPVAGDEAADDLRVWLQPTDLLPLDGLVKKTALQITSGAKTDEAKVQRIYDWIVLNTFREPKVRGCGTGDIKTMLETGNFGGKCADLNGLFVGLCRACGVPARDVYGVRIAPDEFGYKALGGKPAGLQGAQHCRSEVYLKRHGWGAKKPPTGSRTRMRRWSRRSSRPCTAAGKATGWATTSPTTCTCPVLPRARSAS
jgi:transglutaminase-like putative cysteine protease